MNTLRHSPHIGRFKRVAIFFLQALLGHEQEERRIRLTAIIVVLAVVLASGTSIIVYVVGSSEKNLRDTLSRSVQDQISLVQQSLQRATDTSASIANDRPHLKKVLGRLMDGEDTPEDAADLVRILDNIAKSKNIQAIELRDSQGRVLGVRGKFNQQPIFSESVQLPAPALLLWDKQFSLRQVVSIEDGGRRVGEATLQIALPGTDAVFANQEGLGETGEIVMCNRRSPQEMACFPSRWSPKGNPRRTRMQDKTPLPMHFALEGKSGMMLSEDYRGKTVFAAYGTITSPGLGMVMKRDQAELRSMAYTDIFDAIPIIIILSVGGVSLLVWRLVPLVRKLVASRLQLKLMIDSAPDAIVCLDEQGAIRSFNPAAVKLFGYEPEVVIGRHISYLVRDIDDKTFTNVLENGLGMGKRSNGECFHMEITIAKSLDRANAGYVTTLRDISLREHAEAELKSRYAEVQALNEQLKDAQSQLLQSEKMASVGQLAAGVAHEINNPIGYVYSNLGTLDKYVQDLFNLVAVYESSEVAIVDDETRARLSSAKQAADVAFLREDMGALMAETREGITRVKKIVQDLKDFSHTETTDAWRWANLQTGLDSTLNIVWNELKYKAEVRKEYTDIPEIECRASQLNQVFLNLLVNAGHAIEEKGVITLRTGSVGEEVWVEIKDNGKGIAPEHLTRIFDPFFTTKPVGQGTGLGLSLSYGIVQKHGGRIDVQSEVGQGTVFRIWLPIRQSAQSSTEAAA